MNVLRSEEGTARYPQSALAEDTFICVCVCVFLVSSLWCCSGVGGFAAGAAKKNQNKAKTKKKKTNKKTEQKTASALLSSDQLA